MFAEITKSKCKRPSMIGLVGNDVDVIFQTNREHGRSATNSQEAKVKVFDCLSVCLSVCLSDVYTVRKRKNLLRGVVKGNSV